MRSAQVFSCSVLFQGYFLTGHGQPVDRGRAVEAKAKAKAKAKATAEGKGKVVELVSEAVGRLFEIRKEAESMTR